MNYDIHVVINDPLAHIKDEQIDRIIMNPYPGQKVIYKNCRMAIDYGVLIINEPDGSAIRVAYAPGTWYNVARIEHKE